MKDKNTELRIWEGKNTKEHSNAKTKTCVQEERKGKKGMRIIITSSSISLIFCITVAIVNKMSCSLPEVPKKILTETQIKTLYRNVLARFWCARTVWLSCAGNANHNSVLERPVKLFQICSKVFRVCIQQALESRVCCLSFFSSLFPLPSSLLFPLLSHSALQSPHLILSLSIPSSLWISEQVTEYRSHTYSTRRLCVFLDRSEEEGLGFTRLAVKIWDFGFSSRRIFVFLSIGILVSDCLLVSKMMESYGVDDDTAASWRGFRVWGLQHCR